MVEYKYVKRNTRQFGIWSPPADRTRNSFFVFLVSPRNCLQTKGWVGGGRSRRNKMGKCRMRAVVFSCLERFNHPFAGLCGPAVRRSHVFREWPKDDIVFPQMGLSQKGVACGLRRLLLCAFQSLERRKKKV